MIKKEEIFKNYMETKAPKGTRDFLPQDMVKRQFVIDTIRKVYENYGFEQIDTPVFEDWNVLKAKCGEEAKQQIYYFKDKSGRELGLRFDLTTGMARVIAENPDLPKPIKRYSINKAWRYEEVSKGRYREFMQADVDIVGVKELTADAECIACVVTALQKLGLKDLIIRLNNRKILDLLVSELGLSKQKEEVLRALDKLDKIGEEGVIEELKKLTNKQNVEKIMQFARGKYKPANSESAIAELEEIKNYLNLFGVSAKVIFDYSLVRGLGYYTGPIVEIMYSKYNKTVAAGGRYDNLIGIYGKENLPAVGLSIGVERIVDIMSDFNLFEQFGVGKTNIKCFVAPVGKELFSQAIKICQSIREAGINCAIDLQLRSLSKNFEYCNSKGIPKIIIVGQKDIKEGKVTVRDLKSGNEEKVEVKKLVEVLKK